MRRLRDQVELYYHAIFYCFEVVIIAFSSMCIPTGLEDTQLTIWPTFAPSFITFSMASETSVLIHDMSFKTLFKFIRVISHGRNT